MPAGLPRVSDQDRPRDAFEVFVLYGIENLTRSLRRGDSFSMRALHDMQLLQRRLQAFSDALTMRMHLAQIPAEDEPVLVEEE